MGINVEIKSGATVLYEGRVSQPLTQALIADGHWILCGDGHFHVDDCGSIDGANHLFGIQSSLWQSLQGAHALDTTAARVDLKKAVLEGLALDLALQDWEARGIPPALNWG